MRQILRYGVCAALSLLPAVTAQAAPLRGDYLEMRSCDVYTGPCFANGQLGVTGQDALLAWSIDEGAYQGVDLSGLRVVLAIRANDTLGFGGGVEVTPFPIRSVLLVDERADAAQQAALVAFVEEHAGPLVGRVGRVARVPISMNLDHVAMVAELSAGDEAAIRTRKLKKGDCVCTNEEVFYPPLTDVQNSEPAFTVEGTFAGKGLGRTWSYRGSRSAFLATFTYAD